MNFKSFFFWQPHRDYLKLVTGSTLGRVFIIIFNYFIWLFLFYVSFSLIKFNINIFWQILFATILAEIVEKVLKSKVYWKRPMFTRHDRTPPGLVDKWYQTGSFPSGHTIKAVFFLLFCLQYHIINPIAFVSIVTPLLFFRILIGFHYPIDMLGGVILGLIVWVANCWYTFPTLINQLLKLVFDTIFQIPYAG
jgi:membrane-associated phospholipid phosphatase